jgi:hypothetical protein
VDIVERSIVFGGRMRGRHDMFNVFDLVAIAPEAIIGIQTTSTSNLSSRVKKLTQEYPHICRAWLEAGGLVEVWGWKKMAKRGKDGRWWQLTVREITCDVLAESERQS